MRMIIVARLKVERHFEKHHEPNERCPLSVVLCCVVVVMLARSEFQFVRFSLALQVAQWSLLTQQRAIEAHWRFHGHDDQDDH